MNLRPPLRLAYASSLLALALVSSSASAQIVVLRIDPAAETMSQVLEAALSPWGVTPDPGYFDEAQRLGLDPASDDALARLTPPTGAQLAVVPRGDDEAGVYIEFRDGATGAPLGDAEIPLSRGALEARGQSVLEAAVTQRIGPPPSAADADAALDTPQTGESPTDPDEAEHSLFVAVFGGAGLGARDFSWPRLRETRSVETGPFFALELGASFLLALSDSFAFGPELSYQTSLALELEERHVAGPPDTLRTRSHRFDGVLAASIRLGSAGFRLTPAAGVAVHTLRPEVHHLLTPTFSIAGPLLRIALRIPLGSSVALRVAPEVQWVLASEELETLGVTGSGVALGGELALELELSRALSLELTGRSARAFLPSSFGAGATDTGVFATTRLVWRP